MTPTDAEYRQLTQLPDTLRDEESFFSHAPVIAFYRRYINDTAVHDAILRTLSAGIERLPPTQGALLALFCGCFVEHGASPLPAFAPASRLMKTLLQRLTPYCAQEPEEGAAPEEIAQWQLAEQRFAALDAAQQNALSEQCRAAETLVLPLMAMLMRDLSNFRIFSQDLPLLQLIASCADNHILALTQLDYLQRAAGLTYDELVVILPASRSGLLLDAHAINNVFHAISLLQPLLALHADALAIGRINPQVLSHTAADRTCYQWLSALAYRQGMLQDEMALAWGEYALHELPRRAGKLVLVALEQKNFMKRSWSGFCHPIHDAQLPDMRVKGYLTADEVELYLS